MSNVNFYARRELYKGLLGDHPLVSAVIGNETALKSITKADLARFHETYYGARNITLFFAGDYSFETLRQLCDTYFAHIAAGHPTQRDDNPSPKATEAYIQTSTPKGYNRSVYLLGRLLPSVSLHNDIAMKLFIDMLTRGMNSPLHVEIREKRGLAYNLGMHHAIYQDTGILLFSVSTQFPKMDEVDSIFWAEANKILANQERFDEIKLMIKQAALHREHNVSSLVDDAIDDFLDYGRIVSLEEYIQELDTLTLSELATFIQPYLQKDDYLNVRVNCDS